MVRPELGYVSHLGERGSLRSLYAEKPLALVFLRHTGCVFCREQVAMLRDAADLNIAFVTMSPPEELAAFREEMRSPHLFLSDPDRELYDAFSMRRARLAQVFGLRVVKRGFEATRAGHKVGRPVGDPWLLGGVAIISTQGEVVLHKIAEDAADNTTIDEVRAGMGLAAPAAV